MSSVYQINKGINKSIEFKGLKAQYIWWLAGGMMVVLILFAILFSLGCNSYICAAFAVLAGAGIFVGVYHLSDTYGEFGMLKKVAGGSIPKHVISRSRKIFIKD
jgi:hypothetical protein